MLIDWFTIIAQIINFLILLFLLRRFLYRPILNVMQAREERVATLLSEADQKRLEAEQERKRYETKNQELHETYAQRKHEIETSLDTWRKDEMRAARKEVDETLQDWYKTVQVNKEAFTRELNQFAVRQTYAVARRAVQDLAGAELEAVMVRVFLENLNQNKWDFGHLSEDGAGQSATSLKLRSAFNLPPDLQDQLRSHIQDQIKNPVDLHFESDPNLLSGIEIVWESGYTAVWNLQRYLDTLQDELEQQMNGYLGAQTLAPDQVEA